jgi:hypothetical protein
MMGVFTGIAQSIGKEAFESTLAKYELAWARLSTTPPDSAKAAECYREMLDLEKGKAGHSAQQAAQQQAPPPAEEQSIF